RPRAGQARHARRVEAVDRYRVPPRCDARRPVGVPYLLLRGIDFHVHPCDERVTRAWAGEAADYERFFRGKLLNEDLDATAERYRGLDLFGVVLGADAETTTGVPAYPNDELADACRKHADVFVGFAGIDPWKGDAAVRELERS